MENTLKTNKKGQVNALGVVLTGFVIIAAVMVLLVLLIYTFGTVYTSLETVSQSNTVTNESFNGVAQGAWINLTGYTLDGTSSTGEPRDYVITQAWNQSSATVIPATNYTVSTLGVVTNTTTAAPFNSQWFNVTISYTYTNNSASQQASRDAGTNTSRAIPLVGILLIILAVGALITILIMSLTGRRRA